MVLDLVAFGLGVAEPHNTGANSRTTGMTHARGPGIHRSDCAAAANHIETFCFGNRQLCGAQY